jgi:DNA-binding NarL/FixJ family response regulator
MNIATRVVIVEDHALVRKGLSRIISELGYTVLLECENGTDFINRVDKNDHPDVVLMDINMPEKLNREMDGFKATLWASKTIPLAKVIALSMLDSEKAIIRMIKNGARGYVIKDSDPMVLKTAIDTVVTKGFYYSELVTGKMVHSIQHMGEEDGNDNGTLLKLKEREIEFLKLASTEMTYKEIADKMFVSPRTVDGYRDELFEKLNVKSRVGLVLYAIKNGIMQVT